METVHVAMFANASNLACFAASRIDVEYSLGVVKGLLTSDVKDLYARHCYSKITLNQWSNGG